MTILLKQFSTVVMFTVQIDAKKVILKITV